MLLKCIVMLWQCKNEAGAAAHRLDGAADVLEDGEGTLVAPHQPQANQRRLQCRGHNERYPMACHPMAPSGQALQQS